MLKHVCPQRSTSSLARTSSTSLRRQGETSLSSQRVHEGADEGEDFVRFPDCLRRSQSSPESCSSDEGLPMFLKDVQESSGASRSGSINVSSESFSRSSSINDSSESFSRSGSINDSSESFSRSGSINVSSESFSRSGSINDSSESFSRSGSISVSPESFKQGISDQESGDEDLSSPEIPKKDLTRPTTLPRRGGHKILEGVCSTGQVLRKSYRSADSCSLHSTCSYSSLATSKLSSRSSSTSSLGDQTMTPVKVYLRFMKPDIEYKTINLSSSTTCRELVLMLLAKFRLRHRDPNLFFVRMEVVVRAPGGGAPARRLLVLEDHACPAELQQCRPRGEARFSVGVRRGGLLRVYDSILMPGSQYKSLLVSYRTTADELVHLLLNCYSNKENPKHYTVHEVNKNPYSDRPLRPEECPLLVQSEWPRAARANLAFVLRRNVSYALSLKSRVSWRHSLDQSSTDTDSDQEDQITAISTTPITSPITIPITVPITSTIPITRASSIDSILSTSLSESFRFSSSVTVPSSTQPSTSPSTASHDSGFSSPSSSSRSSNVSTDSPTPPSSPCPSVSSFDSSSTYISFNTDSKAELFSTPISVDLATRTSQTLSCSPPSPAQPNVVFTSATPTTAPSCSTITIDIKTHTSEPSSPLETYMSSPSLCSASLTSSEVVKSSSSETVKSSSDLFDITPILCDSLLTSFSTPPSPSTHPKSLHRFSISTPSTPLPSRSLHLFPLSIPSTPPSTPKSLKLFHLPIPSRPSSPPRVIHPIPLSTPSTLSSPSRTLNHPFPTSSPTSPPCCPRSHYPTSETCRSPLQRTIITISASGDPVVTSNTLLPTTTTSSSTTTTTTTSSSTTTTTTSSSTTTTTSSSTTTTTSSFTITTTSPSTTTPSSTSASLKELAAALESLRTLAIRCPDYDNCFYI